MPSYSNSGLLRSVGDTVILDRKPSDDAVGVQVHGDADGVELLFEGAMAGSFHALPVKVLSETIPRERDGKFTHIVSAPHCTKVLVKLVAIKIGSLFVSLHSGAAAAMEAMMKAHASDRARSFKLGQAKND